GRVQARRDDQQLCLRYRGLRHVVCRGQGRCDNRPRRRRRGGLHDLGDRGELREDPQRRAERYLCLHDGQAEDQGRHGRRNEAPKTLLEFLRCYRRFATWVVGGEQLGEAELPASCQSSNSTSTAPPATRAPSATFTVRTNAT